MENVLYILNIQITFVSILIDITEVEKLEISVPYESTIRNLLDQLATKFGSKFEELIFKSSNDLSKYVIIVINGKDIRLLEGIETKIQDNSKVSFIPAIAGG